MELTATKESLLKAQSLAGQPQLLLGDSHALSQSWLQLQALPEFQECNLLTTPGFQSKNMLLKPVVSHPHFTIYSLRMIPHQRTHHT